MKDKQQIREMARAFVEDAQTEGRLERLLRDTQTVCQVFRDKHIDAFAAAIIEQAREKEHHVVRLKSAIPLTENQRSELREKLSKKFKGTLQLEESIDPSVLGGLVVEIADWRVDASLKGKINRLRTSLMYAN